MLIPRRAALPTVPAAEITPRHVFERRRQFLKASGALAGAGLLPYWPAAAHAASPAGAATATTRAAPPPLHTDEPPTDYQSITTYNNFYEFGTAKEDPARSAQRLQTRPWTLRVEGLVGKPRTFDIDDLLKLAPQEERVYRLRCVEAWSMVIPWQGFPLSALIEAVAPLGSAKYVEFVTHYDRDLMTRRPVLDWPYTEGLRLDEALHPLTLLAFGLYGEPLPKQNGAPVRLVVPWKYGFKSAKSLVAVRLVEQQPATAWNKIAPQEYGFYSNVNPAVSHPRWSQATERRIGELRKRPTLPFNGYAEQVASLYQGMDLRTFF